MFRGGRGGALSLCDSPTSEEEEEEEDSSEEEEEEEEEPDDGPSCAWTATNEAQFCFAN